MKDDVEIFDSAEELRDWLTPQAIREFKGVRVRTRGRTVELAVRIVRASNERLALPHVPGVAVEVVSDTPANEERVERACKAVAATISRGGFFFSREPAFASTRSDLDDTLARRVRRRNIYMSLIYGTVFALAIVAVPLVADDASDELVWIAVGALVGVPVVVSIIGVLPDTFRAHLRGWVDRAVFPAVEIADIQPGRRLFRLALRLAPVVAVPVVPEIVQAIPGAG